MRNAYLLTTDVLSDRAICAKTILSCIGFQVHMVKALPRIDDNYYSKLESNRNTMMTILDDISNKSDLQEFHYIFEDDVNIMEPIPIEEIIEYEKISKESGLFYLGCCRYDYNNKNTILTEHNIAGYSVYKILKYIRGSHAFAVTPICAKRMCDYYMTNKQIVEEMYKTPYDIMMEMYVHDCTNGVNVIRYDLESYIKDHFGIFYQDRGRFPTIVGGL
jgi:hypothetical protein